MILPKEEIKTNDNQGVEQETTVGKQIFWNIEAYTYTITVLSLTQDLKYCIGSKYHYIISVLLVY